MDWFKRCAHDSAQKRSFHIAGMKRLRMLAEALGFKPDSFDIRSNAAGIAVSGEVILHHENLYVKLANRRWAATSAF